MSDFTPTPLFRSLASDAFATLGRRRLAYVRMVRSEDVGFFCPDAPLLAPGRCVFVLSRGDGTPILVTDTREAASPMPRANSSKP